MSQGIFGPLRLERLEKQLRAQARGEKEALEEALAEIGAEREETEDEEPAKQLARVPDLSKALAEATPELQRQVFQAFDLQIAYDKVGRRIEISATISEAVANAFEKAKALHKEGSAVVAKDIAGARFVSRYHPRIVERIIGSPNKDDPMPWPANQRIGLVGRSNQEVSQDSSMALHVRQRSIPVEG